MAVEADVRTNSLIVWAAPSEMENIRSMIERLDTTKPGPELIVKVIRLQRALAEDFAAICAEFGARPALGRRNATTSTGVDYRPLFTPDAAAVTVDAFKEDSRSGRIRIHASIHVERDSQKGIVIGKGGRKLKEIGQAAREDIERLLAARVYLELFVRVQKNWSRDTRALRKFGY